MLEQVQGVFEPAEELLLFMPLACIRIVTTAEVNAAKAEARMDPTGR